MVTKTLHLLKNIFNDILIINTLYYNCVQNSKRNSV
nr:MAG TPA: hypothetical protein [Caudoviricetes sp.]